MEKVCNCSLYKHYKGGLYYVVGLAIQTETEELMVVYHALYGECDMFVRPLKMFNETVEVNVDGEIFQRKRFELIEGDEKECQI